MAILGCSSRGASGATSGPGGGQPGTFPDAGTVAVGQIEGGVSTKLPTVPAMTNVLGTLNDDSVSITFYRVEGALDYRVYPLPSDSDISVAADNTFTVHNAVYRCAGDRESPAPTIDNGPTVQGSAIHTEVDQEMVGGYMRTLAGATLGYVYSQPGPGLTPVYALGESDPNADNSTCYFARWAASRVKKYTTSASERSQLLANLARDDGIAFYVPSGGGSTTKQVFVDAGPVRHSVHVAVLLRRRPRGERSSRARPLPFSSWRTKRLVRSP